jgi:hypothetical protein
MEKNDSLLISASYFWSDAVNAFLFGHGLMTPTLADVYILTGLKITGSSSPYAFISKGSEKLDNMRYNRGWPSYVHKYMASDSEINSKEYIAFMNMWLERFLFHSSAVGPTANHLHLAKRLIAGDDSTF